MSNRDLVTAPTALIFFNRPGPLARTFAEIRRARPRELFLIQDGPRADNSRDADNIQRCRDIVDEVDWECTVHRNYSETNLGTGRRVSSGLTWAFSIVDRLIILEDDCLAAPDFFPFCTALLQRYLSDERIGMITGMNHLGEYEGAPSDYFFSRVGSIAGWATWRRVWETVDQDLAFLEDVHAMRLLKEHLKARGHGSGYLDRGRLLKGRARAAMPLTSWSYPLGISDILYSRLIIVPRVNLMGNIGIGADGANTADSINKVPRAARFLYRLPLHEIGTDLIHPTYVAEDLRYNREVDKLMGRTFFRRQTRRAESFARRVLYGENPMDILRRRRSRRRQDGEAMSNSRRAG